jgi:dTDP-4-dehydrorhamnose 3,5-epimerase
MKIETTFIPNLLVVKPRIFCDERGYFFESYSEKRFKDAGIEANFIQDNQSFSDYGTLRGLHLQTGDKAQAKLVRVTLGKVLDVAVDLRPQSSTFGKYFCIELSDENQFQFFIPRGFAHGFVVLSEKAIFNYKVDNYYAPEAEAGIIWNDPDLAIDWSLESSKILLSRKDLALPSFKKLKEVLS